MRIAHRDRLRLRDARRTLAIDRRDDATGRAIVAAAFFSCADRARLECGALLRAERSSVSSMDFTC